MPRFTPHLWALAAVLLVSGPVSLVFAGKSGRSQSGNASSRSAFKSKGSNSTSNSSSNGSATRSFTKKPQGGNLGTLGAATPFSQPNLTKKPGASLAENGVPFSLLNPTNGGMTLTPRGLSKKPASISLWNGSRFNTLNGGAGRNQRRGTDGDGAAGGGGNPFPGNTVEPIIAELPEIDISDFPRPGQGGGGRFNGTFNTDLLDRLTEIEIEKPGSGGGQGGGGFERPDFTIDPDVLDGRLDDIPDPFPGPGNGNNPPENGNTPPGNGNNPPGNGNNPPGNGNTPPGNGNNPPGNGNTPPGNGNNPPGNGNNPGAPPEDDCHDHPWWGHWPHLPGWPHRPPVCTPVPAPGNVCGGVVYLDGCWSYCESPVLVESVCVIEIPAPVVATGDAAVEMLPTLEIPAGAAFKLEITGLGDESGFAIVELQGLTLPVQILDWSASAVALQLPGMGLDDRFASVLTIVRKDGTTVQSVPFTMIPAVQAVAAAE